MQETRVLSLGQEDPPEEETATHSRILAWRIPGTEEPGGLQSGGLQESDTTEAAEHKLMREAGLGSPVGWMDLHPHGWAQGERWCWPRHGNSVSAPWPQGNRPLRVRQASPPVPEARTPRPPDTRE